MSGSFLERECGICVDIQIRRHNSSVTLIVELVVSAAISSFLFPSRFHISLYFHWY